jgi:hypothetical protein
MTATVIFADFTTKTWHKPQTLEQMATELAEQFNKMAEEGTEVIAIPYGGQGIDGMIYETSLGYVAPDSDPA